MTSGFGTETQAPDLIVSRPQTSEEIAKSAFPALEAAERVVLLIDISRSMSQTDYPPTRLHAAKQAALAFIDKKMGIDESDEVAVVTFSARGRLVCPMERVSRSRDGVQRRVARLKISYSGTQIAYGLRKAASLLNVPLGIQGDGKKLPFTAKKKGGADGHVCRIVLLSDGENMAGPDPIETAERLKRSGVVIDCIGIGERGEAAHAGEGLDEKMLINIASPGRYKYIRDPSTLLYHFETLAEKVIGDWGPAKADAIKGPALVSKLGDPADGSSGALAGTGAAGPARSRHWMALRDAFIQLSFGAVPALILGALGLRYAFETEAWTIPWAAVGSAGLLIAWLVRLGVYGIATKVGAVAALVSVVGAYLVGALAHLESVDAVVDWLTDDPSSHAISAGIMAGAVVAGMLLTPPQVISRLARLPKPWSVLIRRRYAFFRLREGSPFIGHPCLNEKDNETALKVGDLVVMCPVCGEAHHADCWIWNDGHCYGGDTPCEGRRPIPSGARN